MHRFQYGKITAGQIIRNGLVKGMIGQDGTGNGIFDIVRRFGRVRHIRRAFCIGRGRFRLLAVCRNRFVLMEESGNMISRSTFGRSWRLDRIRQKTKSCNCTGNTGSSRDPEGRFFIMKDSLDSVFQFSFTESQRADNHDPFFAAAGQQSVGIGFLLLKIHIPDDLFVTGKFKIPAEQSIGRP